jgi:hypothetical protein
MRQAERGYADALRAVGRFLDEVHATDLVLQEHDQTFELRWFGRRHGQVTRSLWPTDVDALRVSARLYRGLEDLEKGATLSEALRTLGRILDEEGATGVTIRETSAGFELTARTPGGEFARSYAFAHLLHQASLAHHDRAQP